MRIVRNFDSWMQPDQLGKFIPPYRRTFDENGDLYINPFHASLASCPLRDGIVIDLGIAGWQRPEDALKLYELAYHGEGDVLELGCFQGLSTTIMARAIVDAKRKKTITSVDNNLRHLFVAWKNLRSRGLQRHVRLRLGDARKMCAKLVRARRTFGLVFVDDWHSYDSVLGVCRFLPDLLIDGGFCLFHDYNDSRNADPNDRDYGVPQAISDGLSDDRFEFYGIAGCTALFRKKAGTP